MSSELHDIQLRFLEWFFPGLVEVTSQLAPGTFVPEKPKTKGAMGGKAMRAVALRMKYKLDDGSIVAIRLRLRLRVGVRPYAPERAPVDLAQWDMHRYSFHYGKPKACAFRFDLDNASGHHVHMLPNTKAHVPAELVTPDTSKGMLPQEFIRIVADYKSTGIYPVERKNEK